MDPSLSWQFVILLTNLIVCNSQTYCSGTQYLSATNAGEIVSHSGVGVSYYQNSMACYWQITAPIGSLIYAYITYVDVETSYDYVSIYDGSIGSTSLISKVSVTATSGYVSPVFTSSSYIMTVYFYSDSSLAGLGFRLRYYSSTSTSSSSCGLISYSNSSNISGVVTSHVNYGSASYSPNMFCSRTLPKRSGYTVSLSVTALSLGSGDCLQLPTSSFNTNVNASSTTYCGSYILISGGQISIDVDDAAQIVFFSNGQTESTGFSISFQYAALLESNFSLSNDSGEIISHSGVGVTPYSNNVRYFWQITTSTGSLVQVKFTYINLLYPNDAVSVYDSTSGQSVQLAAFTGSSSSSSSLSQTFTSASNVMTVRFKTDGSGAGLGFRLQFNASLPTYCSGFTNVSAANVSSGQIVSHSSVRLSNYQNNMNCYWQINAPLGYTVAVSFVYLDLDISDLVTLYDGIFISSSTFSIITTSSGLSASSRTFTSTSNVMTVYFTSDSSSTRRGFVLQYMYQSAKSVDQSSSSSIGAIAGGTAGGVGGGAIAVAVFVMKKMGCGPFARIMSVIPV